MQFTTDFVPQKCWAVVKATGPEKGLRICSSPAEYYELDSKTSNISPGPTVRVWLCNSHKGNASRHYKVTKVPAP